MKKHTYFVLLTAALFLTSCGNGASETALSSDIIESQTEQAAQITTVQSESSAAAGVASGDAVLTPDPVGYEGMTAVFADDLKEGTYEINVDSSSSMFRITKCELTVNEGKMTAFLTMSGSGYEALYMGTAEEAVSAPELDRIPSKDTDGVSCFTVPVEALDQEIACAAFSKKKQLWYDRTLVFRADSLPSDALPEKETVTVESLGLNDGTYTAEVKLEGGSGKASVQSPAKLTVKNGAAFAELIWSSNKYDYMLVDGEKFLPTSTEEFSVFEIPVTQFDTKLKITADTTAMSTPHEIEYTIYFDSASIK